VLFQQGPRVDSVLGPGKAEAHVIQALAGDYVMPYIRTHNEPNWFAVRNYVAIEYPDQAQEVADYGRIIYYELRKSWPDFQDAVDDYIEKYGQHAIPETLNNYALSVFRYCPDEKCNLEALAWSKRAVDSKAAPFFMQTYAEMLYKLGNKDEALVWIQKALDVASAKTKYQYQETLEKMQRGEKFWN
jgi:tetratricopeptide (TPR) repeat protein